MVSVELAAELLVPPALLALEPGALEALELGESAAALEELPGAGERVALPDTLPDAVLPGVVEAEVSVLDEDDALEVGGGVVGVTVVELLLLLVPLPFPVFGRSQPVTAAVANARTATTGMIFFMNFSNQDSVCGFDVNSSSCEGHRKGCSTTRASAAHPAMSVRRRASRERNSRAQKLFPCLSAEHAALWRRCVFPRRQIARRRASVRVVGMSEGPGQGASGNREGEPGRPRQAARKGVTP